MAKYTNIYYILWIVGQNKSSMASRNTSKWENIHPLTSNTSISNNMCRKLPHFGSFCTNEVYSMMLFQIVLHVRFKNRDYLLFLYVRSFVSMLHGFITDINFWLVLESTKRKYHSNGANSKKFGIWWHNALIYIISCALLGIISLLWHQGRHH